MTDKRIGRLHLMIGHVDRALENADPDMKIVEKLLSDALNLAIEINEPPNPYADTNLRPGLTLGEHAARGDIATPPLSRSSEHDVTNHEGKADG